MATWRAISGISTAMAASILMTTRYRRQPVSLYRNDQIVFTDVAAQMGLAQDTQAPVKWGVGFGDFDNDGWPDILIANGNFSSLMDGLETEVEVSRAHSTLSKSSGAVIRRRRQSGRFERGPSPIAPGHRIRRYQQRWQSRFRRLQRRAGRLLFSSMRPGMPTIACSSAWWEARAIAWRSGRA